MLDLIKAAIGAIGMTSKDPKQRQHAAHLLGHALSALLGRKRR